MITILMMFKSDWTRNKRLQRGPFKNYIGWTFFGMDQYLSFRQHIEQAHNCEFDITIREW